MSDSKSSLQNGNSRAVIDETTPLIATANAGPIPQADTEAITAKAIAAQEHVDSSSDDDTPLPKTQILLLCFARMVEPIAFFSIFPFVNQMIYDAGDVPKSDVGFYSGLIESLFSLTQMIFMIPWGWASDRYGRKPVLVISNVGVAVAMTLFGFSSNVWQMILFRCLAGVFSGSVVTIRAMFSEISTPKTQARAFSFFSVAGNVGIFIGPFLGGVLCTPADQYPALFGKVALFKQYPYCLAGIATGAFGLSAALVSAFGVKETLQSKKDSKDAPKPMSTKELIKSPGVGPVLYLYSFTSVLALAYTAVFPVFWFTPAAIGGFGFSPIIISVFVAVAGASQALWTLLAFPPLQHRIGTVGVLKWSWNVWAVTLALQPVCSLLRRNDLDVAFWSVMPLLMVISSSVAMSFTAAQLALNDVAPSHQTLGMLNAIALTMGSAIRAVAPALFASLFATGVRLQILGGYLIWVVFVLMAIMLRFSVRWLPEKAAARPPPKRTSDEEDTLEGH